MNARKVILVTIDNGLEHCDNDWDIVGIYSLDQLVKARSQAVAELNKFEDRWYRNASVSIYRVWIDKPLDFSGALVEKIDLRSL